LAARFCWKKLRDLGTTKSFERLRNQAGRVAQRPTRLPMRSRDAAPELGGRLKKSESSVYSDVTAFRKR
jgi:hypothetical protein